MTNMTRSQLRRRAKLFFAVWMSWFLVGSWVAIVMPSRMDYVAVAAVLIPFALAGRHGMQLWVASRAVPAPITSASRARRDNR